MINPKYKDVWWHVQIQWLAHHNLLDRWLIYAVERIEQYEAGLSSHPVRTNIPEYWEDIKEAEYPEGDTLIMCGFGWGNDKKTDWLQHHLDLQRELLPLTIDERAT